MASTLSEIDGMRGRTLTPVDEDYDRARALWNAYVDRRPAIIAQPTGVADVQRAIEFARSNDLEVAIRGGGHNAAGLASTEGGLMIDLDRMRQVHVDPVQRRARCGGGANWGDYDRETHVHGLAQTGGAVSTTGVAGLTLGGGIGLLMRKQGLTIDNLTSVELVTADSTVIRASQDENQELFWAVRGGGGNFGVVTAFEFKLHDVSYLTDGFLYYTMDGAREVIGAARDLANAAPDEQLVVFAIGADPQGNPGLTVRGTHVGTQKEGESALRPLAAIGRPVANDIAWRSYPDAQSRIDEIFPSGMQIYWRAHFIRDLTDEIIDIIVRYCEEPSSPLNIVVAEQLGGAVSRVPAEDTVFEFRDAGWQIAMSARWLDADDPLAEEHIQWLRSLYEELMPHAYGVYVNYLGVGESANRVRVAYPDRKWKRLVAVKDAYDPDNVFHRNQNVPPSIEAD